MKAQYLGHAAWYVEEKGVAMVFDPFLTGNPQAARKPEDIHVQYVFVTHGHGDHVGDAVAIARRNNALIITTYELGLQLESEGAAVHTMHLGGKKSFDFGYVRVTPSFHGSGVAGGHAAGFAVNLFGKTFYHPGDTALFSDMRLIGELEQIDLAVLPIGGNYTMDIDDASLAAQWLNPRLVVPMHYNTFPVIAAEPEEFRVKAEGRGVRARVVRPGETIEV